MPLDYYVPHHCSAQVLIILNHQTYYRTVTYLTATGGRSIMRCATPLWLWLLPFPWCVSCSTQSPACDETRLLQTAAAIQPLPAFFSVPKVMVFYNLYLGSSTAEMMKFKFSGLVFGCITFSQCAKKLELIPTRFKDSSDAPQDIKRTFLGSPKSCGSSCLISTQRHKNFG